jgi:hypothetical protein
MPHSLSRKTPAAEQRTRVGKPFMSWSSAFAAGRSVSVGELQRLLPMLFAGRSTRRGTLASLAKLFRAQRRENPSRRQRLACRASLDVWWYRGQFAKFLNTAFRLNHPVKGHALPQLLIAFQERMSLALQPFLRPPRNAAEEFFETPRIAEPSF